MTATAPLQDLLDRANSEIDAIEVLLKELRLRTANAAELVRIAVAQARKLKISRARKKRIN